MSRNTVEVDFVTSYKGATNVKKAQTDLERLGAAAKKMAGLFGIAFAGKELVNFGRASVQAFATNQKQVALLTNTLKNLGQEFAANDVNKFIDSLALASGKTKEELIPAFQNLFISTKNVNDAQNELKIALDVSAGTGKDLAAVSQALSKGYLGNTTSLTRLGAGLNKTILATKNMKLINTELSKVFKNDTATAADTVQGKINRLTVATNEAKVAIGEGLVTAFGDLTNSTDFNDSLTKIVQMGENIGNLIVDISRIAKVGSILSLKNIVMDPFSTIKKYLDVTSKWEKEDAKAKKDKSTMTAAEIAKLAKLQSDAAKNQLKIINDQKKATQDKLKAERDSLNLKLAGQTVDMQNIEIQAALQRGQTQSVTDVLLLQRAIINGNADQAEVLSQAILKANGLVMDVKGNITSIGDATNPFKDWPTLSQTALNSVKLQLAQLTANAIPLTVNGTSITGSSGTNSNGSIAGNIPMPTIPSTANSYTPYTGGDLANLLNSGRGTNDIRITVATADGSVLAATQAQSSNGTAVLVNRNQPLAQYQ
jgi:hypothetical protein